MRLLVPVYHRRSAGEVTWTTLGLQPHVVTVSATGTSRLLELLRRRLKELLKERSGAELRPFLHAGDLRLERLRLDLRLAGEKRRRVVGTFPVVVERRVLTATMADEPIERIDVAYHPLRQTESFVVDPHDTLVRQATRFFAERWEALDEREVDALVSPPRKDGLKPVALTGKTASLLDRLPKKDGGLWDDLKINAAKGAKKGKKKGKTPILQRLGDDLTPRAVDGSLGSGRPREPYRSQLQALLCGARKRPVVLLGPPGVGKRTLLRHAVSDMLEADGWSMHRNLDEVTHVWSMAASRLIAGMSYLGEWEKRCGELVDEAQRNRVVLFFEDLVALGRAGQSKESQRSMADFFRGPVERGDLVMIGTATESQWARLEDEAPAFARLFATIRVDEPGGAETLRMMLHEARRLEREHEVGFKSGAFRTILEVGAPLLPDQALPGKALELLRRLGRDFAGSQALAHDGEIEEDDVLDVLAERTGLPQFLLERRVDLSLDAVALDLEEGVVGQRPAVRAVAELVLQVRAGLTDPGRPYGVYLFTGPTGTGKTQLAKELARYLYGGSDDGAERLVRFDMGELSGPDAVSRLVGDRAAPRGLLTEAARQQPFCVLLLDEIEKAHPSVLYLLLQLLEDGRLTDAAGDLANFTRTVIVMTSNLGARAKASVGFGEASDASLAADVAQAVRAFFPPELFNRIDRVVPFAPLGRDAAETIARRELESLLARRGLTERNVFVSTHASAARRMAEEAFDPSAGARSVRRYLETEVGAQLAEHLASRARGEMEVVRLYADPEATDAPFRLASESLVEAPPLDARYAIEGLEEAPFPALLARLPDALAELDALMQGGGIERLGSALGASLEGFAAGRAEAADAAYYLELLRDEVAAFRERLDAWVNDPQQRELAELEARIDGRRVKTQRTTYRSDLPMPRVRTLDRRWIQTLRPPDRDGVLQALAEVGFLRRALAAPAGEGYACHLELQRVTPRSSRARLLATLAASYAGARGEVVAAAHEHEGEFVALSTEDLPRLSKMDPQRLVLAVVGVQARDFFREDEGSHVLAAVAEGSEIVRVRVLPADRTPLARLEESRDARRAFERALDEGLTPLRFEEHERLKGMTAAVRVHSLAKTLLAPCTP
ncbi:MAG: AAA family ATPase, partial [Myxococcota bacterium]